MTWIQVLPLTDAHAEWQAAFERQGRFYPSEYSEQLPGLPEFADGIVSAHSLIPDAMEHAFSTFGALLSDKLPLTRRQHELIATAVSQANCTSYCSAVHSEFLRRLSDSEDGAISSEVSPSSLASEADEIILAYARQITEDATKIDRSWHERLRSVGFDDRGILQITMIAAWFNYINRMADALGVGRD